MTAPPVKAGALSKAAVAPASLESASSTAPASPSPDAARVSVVPRGKRPFAAARHCGATTRKGVPCTKGKGERTDHPGIARCYLHGGSTPNGKKHAANEAVAQVLATFGVPLEKDPGQALLELVWEAAGNVAYLRRQVAAMSNAEIGKAGLIGTVIPGVQAWRVKKDDIAIPVTEEVRAIVKLYGEWCDRLAKYSKAAIDTGIQQRIVDAVDREADVIVAAFNYLLDHMGLTPDAYDRARLLAADALEHVRPMALSGADLN